MEQGQIMFPEIFDSEQSGWPKGLWKRIGAGVQWSDILMGRRE